VYEYSRFSTFFQHDNMIEKGRQTALFQHEASLAPKAWRLFSLCSHIWPRAREAGMVYYVALLCIHAEGGLAPGEAVECPSGGAAIRRAQAMAFNEVNAGAMAFSRSGDPNLGEFADAVILALP
jgi:hypothetical protein